MLKPRHTKIVKLEDKTLNEIMQKLQAGQETTQEEKDKLFKALSENKS